MSSFPTRPTNGLLLRQRTGSAWTRSGSLSILISTEILPPEPFRWQWKPPSNKGNSRRATWCFWQPLVPVSRWARRCCGGRSRHSPVVRRFARKLIRWVKVILGQHARLGRHAEEPPHAFQAFIVQNLVNVCRQIRPDGLFGKRHPLRPFGSERFDVLQSMIA